MKDNWQWGFIKKKISKIQTGENPKQKNKSHDVQITNCSNRDQKILIIVGWTNQQMLQQSSGLDNFAQISVDNTLTEAFINHSL